MDNSTYLGDGIWLHVDDDGTSYKGQMLNFLFHGKGKIQYAYGEEYEGDFIFGKYDGIGRKIYHNSDSVYEGEFCNGIENGKGKLTFSYNDYDTSEEIDGEYIGDFKDGKYFGRGVFKLSDGTLYEGEFRNGIYHGNGSLKLPNGEVYIGKFYLGQYSGFGKISFPYSSYFSKVSISENAPPKENLSNNSYTIGNKSYEFWGSINKYGPEDGYGILKTEDIKYEGYFKNSKYHGFGKLNTKTDSYVGHFEEGKFHGYGELESYDHRYDLGYHVLYSGEFKNGLFDGIGILKYVTSPSLLEKGYTKCVGRFKKGGLIGEGSIYMANGSIYKGETRSNDMEGRGKLTFQDGRWYLGNFSGGIAREGGILSFPDGRKFIGNFAVNKFNGHGTFFLSDNKMYVGQFKNDMFHGKGIFTQGIEICYIGDFEKNSFLANESLNSNEIRTTVALLDEYKYYLFIDTETTGLPIDINASLNDFDNWPRLVQVSYVLFNNNQELITEADFVIQPNGFKIPSDSIEIHGITNEEAKEKGHTLESVLTHLFALINKVDCLIGHNISFDEKILGSEFLRNNMINVLESKKKFCTMKYGIEFYKKINSYNTKWPTLKELYSTLFGYTFENSHNALADAKATAECFWELKRRDIIQISKLSF